jgi:hypothetical protein
MVISLLLLAAVGAIVVFGVALTLRSKKDFDDANEVVPGVKSAAPASWAGAHSSEAKLHRRLGESVRAARNNPRLVELGLSAQTKQIESEALAIDERLVAAAHLPASHRSDAVAALEPHVVALEEAVATLITGTTVGQSKALLESVVSEADIKLQALAQARAEVEQLDQQASGRVTDESGGEPGTATG